MQRYFEAHRAVLDAAVAAAAQRTYWSAAPETPSGKIYAARVARTKGAITAGVYSTSETVLDEAADKLAAADVNLSCNLTGGGLVNQNAAFSDCHVSGANPAGNACLTATAFVASRFRTAGVRRSAAA